MAGEAGELSSLELSDTLSGDLLTEDAPQPAPEAVVTYCFIVDDAPVATQEAREGDAIERPADPAAPEGYAFIGWFLEDGVPLFADADGDGEIDPVIAHPNPLRPQIVVTARFEAAEEPAGQPTDTPEAFPSGEGAERSEAEEVPDDAASASDAEEEAAPDAGEEAAPGVAGDETPEADAPTEEIVIGETDKTSEAEESGEPDDPEASDDADAPEAIELDGITPDFEQSETMENGWYVSHGGTIGTRIEVKGVVNLILADDTRLCATSGIHVPADAKLTIWAQSTGDRQGRIEANNSNTTSWNAAIGGNAAPKGFLRNKKAEHTGVITINGGHIYAYGRKAGTDRISKENDDGGPGICGEKVTINGGDVTAVGEGCGKWSHCGPGISGELVTVNGGCVWATGSVGGGAGIEGAAYADGCDLTINGGEVHAFGGNYGPGIGAGFKEAFTATITINGGSVYARSGENINCGGAGIGSSYYSAFEGTVIICGGYVEAKSLSGGGAGIGAGEGGNARNGHVHISGGTVIIKGSSRNNEGEQGGDGIGTDGNLEINVAQLVATGDGNGIHATKTLIVRDGDVAAHGGNCGIRANQVGVSGANTAVTAKATGSGGQAVTAAGDILMSDGLGVVAPTGGKADGGTVLDRKGKPAREVTISGALSCGVWVGRTEVTSANDDGGTVKAVGKGT